MKPLRLEPVAFVNHRPQRETGAREHRVTRLPAQLEQIFAHTPQIGSRLEPRQPGPQFCRHLRSLYPPDIRIAIVLDSFPHT